MADQPQNLRGLKALVGGMAVLIIIGTTVVVGTVIHRLYARFNAPPTPPSGLVAAPSLPASAPPSLAFTSTKLAPGEHIAAISGVGTEVAVLVTSPQGEKLLILNPASGVVQTVLSTR